MKNLVSIKDLTKEEIIALLEEAKIRKANPSPSLLKGYLMASCFFEPSTRTRFSFESAMKRLGGEVLSCADGSGSSMAKGETLFDTIKTIGLYSDLVVLRHPAEGSAKVASEATTRPVINAGDGANEHPTQTLLDLFSIQESQGRLEGLKIAFVGDLLYGRTVHSLALSMHHFENRLYFVSPPTLQMPDKICEKLRRQGIPFSFHQSIEEVLGKVDILYMTRVQKERFPDQDSFEKRSQGYRLTVEMLAKAKENLRVLHPLPRLQEISPEVDKTPYAYYFTQAENGVYVRQALLTKLLGVR
ncbi:MAG: Aspartate carbamoyltransferase catalytic chain [Chlamydiae bacterium]|nr:Aspartate carbamoyltransferase catalytic chain [Chlamydiota bacterium]